MKYFYTALVAAVLCANSQSANAFGIGKVAHVTKHVGGKVIDVAKDQVVEHQDAIKDHVVDNVRDHALDVIPYGHVVVPVAEDVIRKVHDNTSETQRQVNVQSYPHAMLGESRKEKRQERHERWKKNFHDMWNKSDDDSDKQSDEGEETDAIQKAADEAAAKIEDEISDKVSEDDLAEFQDEAEEQVGNFENWVDENKDVVEDQQDEWVNHSKEAEDAAVEQVKKTKKKEQDKAEDMQAKGEKGAQQIKEEAEAKAQQEIENQQSEGTAKKMEDKAKEEAEQVKEKVEHNVDNVSEAGESAVEKIKNKLDQKLTSFNYTKIVIKFKDSYQTSF